MARDIYAIPESEWTPDDWAEFDRELSGSMAALEDWLKTPEGSAAAVNPSTQSTS